jgi:hypothetical protein
LIFEQFFTYPTSARMPVFNQLKCLILLLETGIYAC